MTRSPSASWTSAALRSLENNIMQTAGWARESIAFGIGGLLGILMMIPLRRALIVKQRDP